MNRNTIFWTYGPAICAFLYLLVVSQFYTDAVGDLAFLIEQAVLAIALVTATIWFKKTNHAGWNKISNNSWIWIAGPLWLVILTPLGLAIPNIIANPQSAILWIGASLFVGINEEILFRGYLLRGLREFKGPMLAAIISSLIFGLMHCLNGLSGADPIFLIGQMCVALGTGMVLCALTYRAGSIWPAVILHFTGDAVGLSTLGGYQNAVQTAEAAPGMIILGAISFIWGAFWIWKSNRNNTIIATSIT